MKISRLLVGGLLAAVTLCGCRQRSTVAPAAGTFQLVVDDLVKDGRFRVASLKVISPQPATLSVETAGSHAGGDLLISSADKLRAGQILVTASRVAGQDLTNALIQASLQVKLEGGDGGMLIHGSFQSEIAPGVYEVSPETKLDDFLSLTAREGTYPLHIPLEIGRLDGKPITLTVGKPIASQEQSP